MSSSFSQKRIHVVVTHVSCSLRYGRCCLRAPWNHASEQAHPPAMFISSFMMSSAVITAALKMSSTDGTEDWAFPHLLDFTISQYSNSPW